MSSPDWQAGWSAGYDAGYAAGLKAGQSSVALIRSALGDPAPPAAYPDPVQTTGDAPFWLLITRSGAHLHQEGPFTLITDAIASRDAFVDAQRGDLAFVYDGDKVSNYRGGPAEFRFGLSQWSRA